MNKYIFLPILSLPIFVSSASLASVLVTIVINCPVTSGNPVNELHNFNNLFISGNGILTANIGDGPQNGNANFRTMGSLPAGTPTVLTSYFSTSAIFNNDDPSNPFVTCTYHSSNLKFPELNVVYTILNGFGALLSSTTSSSVTLTMPLG